MIRAKVSYDGKARRVRPYIGTMYQDGGGLIVVLFKGKDRGTCLAHWVEARVGESCEYWAEKNFAPLAGSITLRNE